MFLVPEQRRRLYRMQKIIIYGIKGLNRISHKLIPDYSTIGHLNPDQTWVETMDSIKLNLNPYILSVLICFVTQTNCTDPTHTSQNEASDKGLN